MRRAENEMQNRVNSNEECEHVNNTMKRKTYIYILYV